jgi:hypothetical protein
MSDNWITLIPEDPQFIPSPAAQDKARDSFAAFAPEADAIDLVLPAGVQFFDCGSNFESICCPRCGETIEIDWWQDRMGKDNDGEFKLAAYPLPCCGVSLTLNELAYECPQGFARFGISAMNPNIGRLSEEQVGRLAEILGCKARVIYQHI